MDLDDLTGVGPVAEERLNDAGVHSVQDLAEANLDDLVATGMSESKAQKLQRRAKRSTVMVKSGAQVEEELRNKEHVPTGIDLLDGLIGGGWAEGNIVAVYGPTGTGKTQIAFHSLARAVEATGRPVVYIETERGRFSPKRIKEFADEDGVMEQVHMVEAHDLEQQELAYETVREHFDDAALVVVDSFTAQFRLAEQFEGRDSLTERSAVMGRHLRSLGDMADALGVPVLLTAQIYGTPSQYGTDTPYGGTLFQHTVNYFLRLKPGQGSLTKAEVKNHPEVADTEFHISIDDETLRGVEDA